MRLAPVVIRFFRDRAAMRDAAARQSKTTHAAPEAVDACVFFAERIADAIEGASADEVLASHLVSPTADWAGRIAEITAGSWREHPRDAIRGSGYVADALEAALWSIHRSGDFRSAILTAANLGEDADTTAAITGQLAGALWGANAIPGDWRSRLAWGDEIEATAARLYEAGLAAAAR